MANKLTHKIKKTFFAFKKNLHQITHAHPNQKSILFIIGCQRSGTSIMVKVFDKDLNTKCYDEFSVLSSNDATKGIRLNALGLVSEEINTQKAPFVILKPLVESQNIMELLDYFDNSKALWMFRHYKDVVLSNIRHFGVNNGIDDIRPIAGNELGNWRAEKTSEEVRETVSKYFSESMNPYDAAALFWYARNSHFFSLDLDKNPNVLMCKYEDFVVRPEDVVRKIYIHAGQPYPEHSLTSDIHAKSLKKGKHIELTPEIEHLAQTLLDRLETAYQSKPNP